MANVEDGWLLLHLIPGKQIALPAYFQVPSRLLQAESLLEWTIFQVD